MLFVNIAQAPYIISIILALIGIIFFTIIKQKKLRQFFFSKEQEKLFSRDNIKGVKTTKTVCLILATIMIGLSLLDPRGSSLSSDIELEGMDMVLVYDISRSMDVADVPVNRLSLAKNLGEQLIDSLAGNRIGLVAFAADAIRLLPLTSDIDSVNLFVQELSSDMIGSQSTDIGKALDEALKNFAEDTLTHKAIILFSDGENLDGNIKTSIDKIKERGISTFIIGLGTETGGTVPVIDGNSGQIIPMTDLLGKQIISKADLTYLKSLAQDTSGFYYEGTRASMEKITAQIDTIEKSPFGTNTQSFLEPKFRIFIMIALLALLIYLFLPEKKWIKLSLLLLLLLQGNVYGLTTDRKAYQAYQGGEYSTALRFFQRSLAKKPDNLKSKFGEGATLYKLERSDRAEKSFLALTNHENKAIAQQSIYNAGNAKLQGEDFEGALELYKKAMLDNPVDSRIYQKSLTNYLYTRALQQQQQQQNQSKQDSEDQENQENPGNKDQQNQDPQEGENNQENNKENQENQAQQNQNPQDQSEQEDQTPSQSISPSDIDNLLGIAQEAEKESFSKQHKGKQGILQQNKY